MFGALILYKGRLHVGDSHQSLSSLGTGQSYHLSSPVALSLTLSTFFTVLWRSVVCGRLQGDPLSICRFLSHCLSLHSHLLPTNLGPFEFQCHFLNARYSLASTRKLSPDSQLGTIAGLTCIHTCDLLFT